MLSTAAMVSERFAVLLCAGPPASVTLKVNAMPEALAVGSPLITPLAAFSDKPAGRVPPVSDQA